MNLLLLTLALILSAWSQSPTNSPPAATPAPVQAGPPSATAQSKTQSATSVNANAAEDPNVRKAKDLLNQAIEALGGAAYLQLRTMQQTGRTYSFFHGQSTSNGALFWRFVEYPDKERIELTQQRDVAYVYFANKGYEITYRGPHPIETKDLNDYLRRKKFSLDTILRDWLNDPTVALFYEGTALAGAALADKVTLVNSHDEAVSLFLDSQTHLPVKKSISWRDPVDKQRDTEEELWDNYRLVGGVMTPYGFTRYYNGDMQAQRFLFTVSYNEVLNPAMFDPNSGYNPNKPSGKH
jgi:hypothetical protein